MLSSKIIDDYHIPLPMLSSALLLLSYLAYNLFYIVSDLKQQVQSNMSIISMNLPQDGGGEVGGNVGNKMVVVGWGAMLATRFSYWNIFSTF